MSATNQFKAAVQLAFYMAAVSLLDNRASIGRISFLKLGMNPLAQTNLPTMLCNSASVHGRRTCNQRFRYLFPRLHDAREISIPNTTACATKKWHLCKLTMKPTEVITHRALSIWSQTYYQWAPCIMTLSKKTNARSLGSRDSLRSMIY